MAHVPRLYLPGRITAGPLVLPAEASRRLAAVLRIGKGDEVLLFSGTGLEYRATVSMAARGAVHVVVGEVARQAPPSPVVLETWCPLIRANRFDWMVEKAVEAGADVIRPMTTAFTARGEGAAAARTQRWQRIVVEAAEQSGRLYLPFVEPPAAFDSLLGRGRTALVVADASGRPAAELAPLLPVSGHLALAAGPEGGWSDDELRRARGAGALFLRLGPHVLRSETAAVVGTAVLAEVLARAAQKPGFG